VSLILVLWVIATMDSLESRKVLYTKHRAAFEILTDDKNHGIEIPSLGLL
jgi:ribulose 1,5-bisphosphate carboxylase large subunit-like protein